MKRASILVTILLLVSAMATGANPATTRFDGTAAFRHLERLVAIGPRPAGSPAGARTREYIVARRTLRRGEKVRVRGGPLAGLMGVVDAPCSGEERVRVLLDLFRQSVRVEMEAASVAQAN